MQTSSNSTSPRSGAGKAGRLTRMSAWWALFFLLLLQYRQPAWGLRTHITCHPGAPESANAGTCTVSTWMSPWADRTDCTFAKAMYPKTEQELVQAVADAVRHGTKVKVSGAFHSTPKLVCPGSPDGILISTAHYDASFTIDPVSQTVTLGAGLRLWQLLDGLAEAGFGLPNVPAWSALSVVGAISTGAHGSSLDSGPLHDHILSLRLVVPASAEEGYAKVLDVQDGDTLAAARVSLGVLGAISRLTIRVEAASKRRLVFERAGDQDIAERVVSHPRHSQFGDVRWYPGQRQAAFRHEDTVPPDTPGEASYRDLVLEPAPPAVWQAGPALQESALATRNRTLLCDQARRQLELSGPVGYGEPVMGHSPGIQTGQRCLERDPGTDLICFFEEDSVRIFESSAAVPVSRVSDFVKDVERLREQRPDAFCGLDLFVGLYFRYIKGGSEALLGATEDAVGVMILSHRAADARTPVLDIDVLQEVEQLALVKYAGKHHWGKSNRLVSFQGAATKFGERLKRFVGVKERLDPDGLFSSPWSDAVLGIGGTELNQLKPFCALDGLCVCEKDEHCHPGAGYFCRPGLVFPEARVCRFVDQGAQVLKDEL